jgi:hypothetical protein
MLQKTVFTLMLYRCPACFDKTNVNKHTQHMKFSRWWSWILLEMYKFFSHIYHLPTPYKVGDTFQNIQWNLHIRTLLESGSKVETKEGYKWRKFNTKNIDLGVTCWYTHFPFMLIKVNRNDQLQTTVECIRDIIFSLLYS